MTEKLRDHVRVTTFVDEPTQTVVVRAGISAHFEQRFSSEQLLNEGFSQRIERECVLRVLHFLYGEFRDDLQQLRAAIRELSMHDGFLKQAAFEKAMEQLRQIESAMFEVPA